MLVGKINIYKFMEDLDKNGSALAMSNIGEGFLELYKINEEELQKVILKKLHKV